MLARKMGLFCLRSPFLFLQLCITGRLGISGSERERTTCRNVFVSQRPKRPKLIPDFLARSMPRSIVTRHPPWTGC